MYILARKNGTMNRRINEYYADTKEDLNQIPKDDIPMGSKCYVITTGEVYMADSTKTWYPYASGGGAGTEAITMEQLEEKLKPYTFIEEEE